MIVCGGAANANTFLNSIHIFDVTTSVWTAGPLSTGVLSQVMYASHSGMFIVFEGSISPKNMIELTSATPLIFDVAKGNWASYFMPSPGSGSTGNQGNSTSPANPNGGDAVGPNGGDAFGPNNSSTPGNKSKLGIIIGCFAGVIALLLVVLEAYLVRRRRIFARERPIKDTEARAAAMLVAEEKLKQERAPKVMRAAGHYAAARAALGEASKTFKNSKSWISEAHTNSVSVSDGSNSVSVSDGSNSVSVSDGSNSVSVSDGSNSTDFSKARQFSDPEVQANPVLYYQQLLLKQRQLQIKHPHLIGDLSFRSPHSYAAGDHDSGSDSDSDGSGTSSSLRNNTDSRRGNEKKGLTIKTSQVWGTTRGDPGTHRVAYSVVTAGLERRRQHCK